LKVAQKSTKRWFPWKLLRWILAGGVLGLLIWQCIHLGQRLDTSAFRAAVLAPANTWRLALVLALMPINWLIETHKWRLLLLPFHPWTFARCWRGVLAGLSVSAITPNRIGEIGGRLLVARPEEIGGVLTSSLLGSMAQWLAFLALAFPALLWVGSSLFPPDWRHLLWLAIPLGPGLIVLLWWRGKPLLLRLLLYLEQRWQLATGPLREALSELNFSLMLRAGAWAALRFSVYVLQLYLLLQVFGLFLPFWWGVAGIAAIYLLQAGIPLPPGVNLLTRAEIGILLWGNAPAVTAASLAAFGTLFLVNVLIPALPAYWLIVKKLKLHAH